MSRPCRISVCLVLVILAGVRAATAQTTTGSILGDVNDSTGGKLLTETVSVTEQAPLPGVTAKGIPTGFGQPRQAFDAFQGQLGVEFTF